MTEKRLPKYHETFIPILKVLEREGVMKTRDLRIKVRDEFYNHLPEELFKEKTKSGEQLLLNRIGFGKAYLRMGNYVEIPERGLVQITNKGKEVLKAGELTLRQLMADPDFVAHRKAATKDKNTSASVTSEGASPEDMIDSGITEIESQIKSELLERLKIIDPYYFEKVILRLLSAMGYGDFVETAKSGDGGIDGIINQDQLGIDKIYIQAKRFNDHSVREKDIRNFIGAMSGDTTRGVFVTTSQFDGGAIRKANEAHHTIIMIDGAQLVDLMLRNNIGVQIKSTYEVKEIDEDFFE